MIQIPEGHDAELVDTIKRILQNQIDPLLDATGHLVLCPQVVELIDYIRLMDDRKVDAKLNIIPENENNAGPEKLTEEEIHSAHQEQADGNAAYGVRDAVVAGRISQVAAIIGSTAIADLAAWANQEQL